MLSENDNFAQSPTSRRFLSSFPSSRHLLFFVVIIVSSAALRFIGLGHKQLWVDEIIQAIYSRPNSISAIMNGAAQDSGGAPLDYIVQHSAMDAIGTQDEFSARFHAALFGSISVILIYVLSIQLFKNKRIALISAMLLGLYPMHHHYSQEGRPYALFLMLVLILFILYLRIRQRIFVVDTQYSAMPDIPRILRSSRNMALQNELSYRGIRISVLKSQKPR